MRKKAFPKFSLPLGALGASVVNLPRAHTKISRSTRPLTSVSRKSRPPKR